MSARRTRHKLTAVAVLAMVGLLGACDDPPTAVTTAVTFGCEIDTDNILVPTVTGTVESDYTVTAPQAVKPGTEYEVKVVPEPYFVDGTPTPNGTVAETSSLSWRVAIPTGTTLTSHTISGQANVGPGAVTSSATTSYVQVSVPGPIPSNTTATLPTVTLKLKATAALGTTIQQKIHGTSYSAYGLRFTSKTTGTLVGTINSVLSCYPDPSPNLHGTRVSNDVNAPTITIASPVANQSIPKNATVIADFSCSDGDGVGVGVASCVGTVADGAALNTATPGAKTFTVTATDTEGKVATSTVNYTVTA